MSVAQDKLAKELEQRADYLELAAMSKGMTPDEYIIDLNGGIFNMVTKKELADFPDVVEYLSIIDGFNLKAEKHDGEFVFVADSADVAIMRGCTKQSVDKRLKDIDDVDDPFYDIYSIRPFGFEHGEPTKDGKAKRQNNLSWPLLDILELTEGIGETSRGSGRSLNYFEGLRLDNFFETLTGMVDFDVREAWETEKVSAKQDKEAYDAEKAAEKAAKQA